MKKEEEEAKKNVDVLIKKGQELVKELKEKVDKYENKKDD